MIERRHIGKRLRPSVLQVEQGRLAFFAKVTGETNPIYFDPAAAREAGYSAVPAPPTFIFAAQAETGAMSQALGEIGVDLPKVLHGEQNFTYHAPVLAGDTITVESHIADIYDKRNGALEFVVVESAAFNQHGGVVAEMRSVLVVRQ